MILWSRDCADDALLEGEGVAVHVAGAPRRAAAARRPRLMLTDDDGTPRSVLRPSTSGACAWSGPDGTELATWRHDRGRVTEDGASSPTSR